MSNRPDMSWSGPLYFIWWGLSKWLVQTSFLPVHVRISKVVHWWLPPLSGIKESNSPSRPGSALSQPCWRQQRLAAPGAATGALSSHSISASLWYVRSSSLENFYVNCKCILNNQGSSSLLCLLIGCDPRCLIGMIHQVLVISFTLTSLLKQK